MHGERKIVHRDAWYPSNARIVVLVALFVLVVVSVVPWRTRSFYSGGVDVVVVGKALVATVAFVGACLLAARTRSHVPVGIGPAIALSAAVVVSVLGSIVAGNATATTVLAVRVGIGLFTIITLLTAAPWRVSLNSLMAAMAMVALFAAATGLPTLLQDGRLGGGMPEIHPNELAGLAGPPLIALVVIVLERGIRLWYIGSIACLLGVVVLTGSRTALLAIGVAAVLALVTNGVRARGVLIAILVALPIVYSIAAFTGVVDSLATRGGTVDDSTLDSRFTGWAVVLAWSWTSWEKWIGLGLSVKEVSVNERWRDSQVLDSSWVSLLAQAGLLAVCIVAVLIGWALVTALVSAPRRGVLLPLLVLLLFRTMTESGLVDSAMPFVLLAAIASLLTRRSRHAEVSRAALRVDRLRTTRAIDGLQSPVFTSGGVVGRGIRDD